jgi:hypothetical protein
MATIVLVESECSLCGTRSEQRLVNMTPGSRLPDLDSRPAEPARSALPFWVQRCPSCGYCATDISLDYPLADVVLRTEAYGKVLRRQAMPEKAREFLAWALIEAANDEYGGAGWSAVHAAWICDDAEKQAAAAECRQLALERFARQRASLGHITGFEDPGVEELVLADLCRRTGNFAEARRWVETGMARQPALVVQRALVMEQDLAGQKDRLAHSVQELLD